MYQYLLPSLLLVYLIRKYREFKWGFCRNNVNLFNKTCVVTGANSGIGYELCKELAKRDARIILACRNIEKANETILKILKELPKNVKCVMIPMVLDLASLASVREFVDEFNKNYDFLDILVNNAGVSHPKNVKKITGDNFECHFQVNYIGPFLLTNLLLGKMKNGAHARVINVSSKLHEKGVLNWDSLQDTAHKYASSKLMLAYFNFELPKRVENHKISSYAVCPGWVYTNLFRNHPISWYSYILIAPIAFFFMRSPNQGAQTVLYCATEPSLASETGLFYRDCQKYQSSVKFESDVSQRLWDLTEKMVEKYL